MPLEKSGEIAPERMKRLRQGENNAQFTQLYVEVANRFKRLDLVDRVPKELWMEVCIIVPEAVIKTTPKKKKCKKGKMVV